MINKINIGIVEPQDFSQKAIAMLEKIGNISYFIEEDSYKLKKFIHDKKAIFVRLKYNFDKRIIGDGCKLKYICSPTTGLNHIIPEIITDYKINVISLKGEVEFLKNIRATPEHAFGLILSLLRNYKDAFLNSNSQWNRNLFKGHEIYKRKIGIIGLGRVGKLLAKYLNVFGSDVYFYDIDPSITSSYASRISSLTKLIKTSSVIVLCASYSSENINFINNAYLDKMKDKYFINIARGELVDQSALLSKISQNHFSGVALDVLENETTNNDFTSFTKLTKNHNLILTPHIAGATYESMDSTEIFIAQKLIKAFYEK